MGADVLVCMERLDEATARAVERAGVAVVDKATYPKEGVYRLARATGATVTTHFENLSAERLGRADRVTQRAVGDEVWTAFEGCPGPVFTLAVGGRTERETRARREAAADAVETTAVAVMDGEIDFEDTASVLDGGDGVTLSSPEAARTYRDELARRRETA
ncbi:hypothetical protein BRC67_12175, partial [Halobacteriales archaeon QH_3_68_24]